MGDYRHARLHGPQLEVAVEVTWVDRITEPRSEDQAAVASHVARRKPSSGFINPVPLECPHGDLRQG